MNEKKQKQLQSLIDKYKDTYQFEEKNVLWVLTNEIQKLIEFAYMLEGKNVPKIFLGDDVNERQNETTREDDPIQIFLKLTKRCYYNTPTEEGDRNTKMFKSSGVIFSSFPTLQHEYLERVNGEDVPVTEGVFWSDNEFILYLKTKTIKEQFQSINLLERTFNVFGKKFIKENVQAFGIANIEIEEKKDKDSMETAKIHFHIRVQEKTKHSKEFIIEAIKIIADIDDEQEDVSYYEDIQSAKKREDYLKKVIVSRLKKKTANQIPYDESFNGI